MLPVHMLSMVIMARKRITMVKIRVKEREGDEGRCSDTSVVVPRLSTEPQRYICPAVLQRCSGPLLMLPADTSSRSWVLMGTSATSGSLPAQLLAKYVKQGLQATQSLKPISLRRVSACSCSVGPPLHGETLFKKTKASCTWLTRATKDWWQHGRSRSWRLQPWIYSKRWATSLLKIDHLLWIASGALGLIALQKEAFRQEAGNSFQQSG